MMEWEGCTQMSKYTGGTLRERSEVPALGAVFTQPLYRLSLVLFTVSAASVVAGSGVAGSLLWRIS